MLLLSLLLAAVTAQQSTFSCLSVCRVPYFTCIQKGIPGHEIEQLQQCVIDDRRVGAYDDRYPDCVKCIDDLSPETDFPTPTVTTPPTLMPVTAEFCDEFSQRKKKCLLADNTGGRCRWSHEETKCVPGNPEEADGEVPPLDTLQPCLKICQEYALECNFNIGINQNNINGMRACAYELAEEQLQRGDGDARTVQECKLCLEDIFEVIDNPLIPPESFSIFNDYRRWMERQVTAKRCKTAGGKFKTKNPNKPGKCVMNKAKKLKCKKIQRMDVCRAVGCNVKDKKNKKDSPPKCNGRNKWM